MSFEWFKKEEEYDSGKKSLEEYEQIEKDRKNLQKIIDDTIDGQQLIYKLTGDKYSASQKPDDQELNNIGMADLLSKDLEKIPDLATDAEKKMKIPAPSKEDNSNYSSLN